MALATCATVVALAALFARIFIGGDVPHVLADEYAYAAQAKALWSNQQPGPFVAQSGNWLYIFLQSISFAYPDNFLTISRVINALSVLSAGGALFFTFRRSTNDLLTGLIALVGVATFGASHARLFMPEAMQFAVTIFLICAFYKFGLAPSGIRASLLGVLLGIGGMIKIHMFFFAPCILIGIGLVVFIHRSLWRNFLTLAIPFLISFLASAYVIRWGISGNRDMNLLGSFYGGIAEHNQTSLAKFSMYWYVFKRHILTLLLAFPLTIALSAMAIAGLRRSPSSINVIRCTLIVAQLGIIGMLLVTAIFTVDTAGTGPYESYTRIHGRYYEHYLIITLIISSIYAGNFLKEIEVKYRATLLLVAGIMLIFAFSATRNFGWQNPTDFIAAFGLYWIPGARAVALVMYISAALALLLRPNMASFAAILVAVISLAFPALAYDRFLIRAPISDTDKAAKLASDAMLGTKENVEIISYQTDAEIYRAAFHLLNQPSTMMVTSSIKDQQTACNLVTSPQASWYLVIYPATPIHCGGANDIAEFGHVAVYSAHPL